MNSDNLDGTMTGSDVGSANVPEQPVRMKLVNTAAEFLMSPSVQSSSMDMKMSFLKKKGLTDSEIDLAIKQSDARLLTIRDGASVATSSAFAPGSQMPVPGHMYYMAPPPNRWTMFRDVANSAILISGIIYGVYWTYTNMIVPYFYGKKDRKSLDTKLKELDDNLSTYLVNVSSGISKLREDIEKLSDKRSDNIYKEINDLKSEVSSLKKLLLNRKQFPTTGGGLGQISIPSWQITENEEKQQTTPEEEGNGSNGSESSLEMIKE